MARLHVQYPGLRGVVVDGAVEGNTNRVLSLAPGRHVVSLDGPADFEPAEHEIDVGADTDEGPPAFVSFSTAMPDVDRFSPMYCRYNGMLLGQFMMVATARYARDDWPIRRDRMQEFLDEIGVDVRLSTEQTPFGTPEHNELMQQVIVGAAAVSQELAEFVLLGGHLILQGLGEADDPEVAAGILDQIRGIVAKYELPEPDLDLFVAPIGDDGVRLVDPLLTPSLLYLAEVVEQLPAEPETAFVIMPFAPPYAGYFATFYRPTLERAGFRAFRAWGGLSDEEYADLLIRLIAKSGIVWADVSEPNANVFYEIGAAHASGHLSVLVKSAESTAEVPANIGHDTILSYDPSGPDFPVPEIGALAMLISAMQVASARGERLRVTGDAVSDAVDRAAGLLQQIIIPPEAYEARDRGIEALQAHDAAAAERELLQAVALGLDDAAVLMGVGVTQLALGKYEDADGHYALAIARASPDQLAAARTTVASFRDHATGDDRAALESILARFDDVG
ncbi:MAG: hypothetical protein QNJ12_09520 [Ilumatobacter sp.]|uniref:hypothetical protein n=1 Tax=Ilumatobacter sp. TaxID=1967498 RepID=UPI002637CE62|nr:hypothetical protein [Ilumatobacter sp.]MDJ0769022.1 hypothetical protein [Ilumatobacter sp.]